MSKEWLVCKIELDDKLKVVYMTQSKEDALYWVTKQQVGSFRIMPTLTIWRG